jgi:hypothetical protein
MEDKVISEFKVVETEDGFRIEIKGDKERIKEMFKHRGMGFRHHGFGPFGWWFRHGPWGRHGWSDEDAGEPGPTARA